MNTAKDLRKLAKSDPKRLWKKLNNIDTNKSNKTDAVKIEDLYEHLKRLSQDEVIEDNSDIDLTKVPPENIYRILNSPITEEEILNVVKKLKNNKASGYDVAQIPLDEVFPNAYQSTIVALEDDPMITMFDISTHVLSMLLCVKSKPEVQGVFLQTFCDIFKDDANI
ncbi:unnamed protein product [Mytilus coruscus]|uniref:Uncharacterized protein n=1 Tax=Mytilus coruscus TaxID=42192 RepID=A0A6J7ZR07_MYTCO|nr:unnamed protein product [Mytilus coruscus]